MTTRMKTLGLLAGRCSPAAQAWEVGEFKNGMPRAEVEQALKTWNFDKSLPVGNDGLFVYDLPTAPRPPLLSPSATTSWCIRPGSRAAFRHFVVIASTTRTCTAIRSRSSPIPVSSANGETGPAAMFWRKGSDYIGRKYALYPTSEQLSMTWQVNNNCWQAPR